MLELAPEFKNFCRFVSLDQKLFLLFYTITISFFPQMYTPTVDKYPDGLVSHPTAGEQIKQGKQGDWLIFLFWPEACFQTEREKAF